MIGYVLSTLQSHDTIDGHAASYIPAANVARMGRCKTCGSPFGWWESDLGGRVCLRHWLD